MAILKSVFAENYASFADRVEFTCESVTSKKDHAKNTCTNGDYELNLVSYIYGANGSGKSYFCRIFQKIREIIVLSSNVGQVQTAYPSYNQPAITLSQPRGFAFDVVYQDKPSKFGIELVLDGILYHYEFTVFKKEIISEILQRKKLRTETILNRTSSDYKDIELKSELKAFSNFKQVVRRDALCLAVAANLNNSFALMILDSIWRLKLFNMATPYLAPPPEEAFSEERLNIFTKVLRHSDPTLKNISITFSEENLKSSNKTDDFENKEIIEKCINVGVKTAHTLYENGIETDKITSDISFFEEESLGTIKLFSTLPYLYDVLENGDVLILDEIENGLHINLVKEIIQLFTNPKRNPKYAQLIFTSHQPLLLDITNAKRDQVWIMHKTAYGKSFLDRLTNDSGARLQSSLSNRIIEGALGCNPSLFFEDTADEW